MTEELLSTLEFVGNPCAVWLHAENCPARDELMRQVVICPSQGIQQLGNLLNWEH